MKPSDDPLFRDLVKFEHLNVAARTWEAFARDMVLYAPARWASITKQGRRELVPPLFHLHFVNGDESTVRTDKQFVPILRETAWALGTVDAVAIIMEGWSSRYEPTEMDRPEKAHPFDDLSDNFYKRGVARPSQRPDRKEVLWVIVQVPNGEDRWAGWEITSASGKPGRKRRLQAYPFGGGEVAWPTFERMIPRDSDKQPEGD